MQLVTAATTAEITTMQLRHLLEFMPTIKPGSRHNLSGIYFRDGWAYAIDGFKAYRCKAGDFKGRLFLAESQAKQLIKGRSGVRYITSAICSTPPDQFENTMPDPAKLFVGEFQSVPMTVTQALIELFSDTFEYVIIRFDDRGFRTCFKHSSTLTVGRRFICTDAPKGINFAIALNHAEKIPFHWDRMAVAPTVGDRPGLVIFQNSHTGEEVAISQMIMGNQHHIDRVLDNYLFSQEIGIQ